ncbi:MAG: NAD-dependent epimerase/dehydratase family protein [Nitriliruptorales bacterium]|nr:NAD-dependent epimerase/dehydratase family protein [Nitriliruptorales bacterium]
MPPAGRRVLITGISSPLAGMLARALEEREDVAYLVGVDTHEPHHDLTRTEFVRADIRNPLVARVLTAAEIDTVIHLSTVAGPMEAGGRAQMKEQNVIGAMQLLAACQKAESLRTFVLKSSTAVYGSDYTDPGLFREDQTPREAPSSGFAKDATEVESYARSFGRRRKDATVTILRFANFLGERMDSAFSAFFNMPVVPTILGFDPRLQFCHEEDAVEVLRRAVVEDHPGIYNVSGPGVLYLSQCIRLAGRVPAPVPQPLVSAVAGLVRRTGRVDFSPEQLRFLQWGRVGDISKLTDTFGYEPKYSTREAFEDFVARRRISGLVNRDEVFRWERELYDFIQRKGQERFVAARRER